MLKKMILVAVVLGLFFSLAIFNTTMAAEETSATEEQPSLLDGILSHLKFDVSGDLNFSTIYMWRGIMLDGDAVVQPGFYVTTPESKFGRIKLGIWLNHDLENKDNLKSSETDYIIDYTYSFDAVNVSVGHTYYDFPDGFPADGASRSFSREFYAGFSLPKLFLTPSVYYYYDYGHKDDGGGEGSYTVLNLSYSKPFTVKRLPMSLDISGHVAHNNKLYYNGKGGDAAISAGITIPLTKNLSFKPNVNYSVPWGNLSDKSNGNQKDRFFTALYFNYSF